MDESSAKHALHNSDTMRTPQGYAICICLNEVDAGHYGGPQTLSSCVNDARVMRDIAEDLGYDTLLLTDADATVSNFTGAMRNAITNLFGGDSLLLSFSGHGS